jgi:hypothetical protein
VRSPAPGRKTSKPGRSASTANSPGNLFFIADGLSGRKFLVDTGSSFSIIPHSSPLPPSGPVLCAADRRSIRGWGFARSQVRLGGRLFTWQFLKAQVKFPIIGIDFLKHFSMMVDPVTPCLIIGGSVTASSCLALTTTTTTDPRSKNHRAQPPAAPQPPAATAGQPPGAVSKPPAALPSSIQQLHTEFHAVFTTDWGQQPPLHHVVHAIETKGWPVTAKFCRLDPGHLEAELKRMLDVGIIRRSKSQWSSPLHMVPKKDGT